jgi:hypothetical protein
MSSDAADEIFEGFRRAFERGDAPDPLEYAADAPDDRYDALLERIERYLESAPLVDPGPRAQARAAGRRLLLAAREKQGPARRALAERALALAAEAGDAVTTAAARELLADPLEAFVAAWRARAAGFAREVLASRRPAVPLQLRLDGARGDEDVTWRLGQNGTVRVTEDGTLMLAYLDVARELAERPLLLLPAALAADAPAVEWSDAALAPGLVQAAGDGGRVRVTIGRLAPGDRERQLARLFAEALLVAP